LLGFSWLRSDISKSWDTLYATPFIADTAPSCVPKSVNSTMGARACARAEENANKSGRIHGHRAFARRTGTPEAPFSVLPRDRCVPAPQSARRSRAVRQSRAHPPVVPVRTALTFPLPAPVVRGNVVQCPEVQALVPRRSRTP